MRTIALVAAALVALSGSGAAQRESTPNAPLDVSVRINGPLYVEAGDLSPSVLVVNADAIVAGHVEGAVVVISGDVDVSGAVDRDLVVVNGHARLSDTARIAGGVQLFGSDLTRAPGATVVNGVHRQQGIVFAPTSVLTVWLSLTLLFLCAGLLFVAAARRPVNSSAALLAREPLNVIGAGVVVAFGLPVLATLAFVTVIGIPLGLAIVLYVIPALIFTGCVVTAAAIGHAILRRLGWRGLLPETPRETLLATAIGLALLQIVALVPAVGLAVVIAASIIGTGAIAYRLWARVEARHA